MMIITRINSNDTPFKYFWYDFVRVCNFLNIYVFQRLLIKPNLSLISYPSL